MKQIFVKTILIILISYMPYKTFAGFPVGKGLTLLSMSYIGYYSNHTFDNKYHLHKSIGSDYFLSTSAAFFIAHGISRKLDIYCTVPFLFQTSYNSINNTTTSRNDFGDAQLGLSYTIHNKNYQKLTSFKIAAIAPFYSNPAGKLPMGYGSGRIEGTINYVRIAKPTQYKGYFMLQGAYRHYFAYDGPDQFYLDIGREFSLRHYYFIQLDLEGCTSSSIDNGVSLNPGSNKNFNYISTKISIGRRVWRNVTLMLDGTFTPIGRNTGEGISGSFMVMVKLP